MNTILIGTSKFGSPVSDYYKELGSVFTQDNYRVIYIFDGQLKSFPVNNAHTIYFTWPNKRPTKLKDFIFLYKIIKKYKPILCLSNFGSTNVITIVSFLLKVKYRINYIHTTTKQIDIDSKNIFKTKILRLRKKFIYKLNTSFLTNSKGTKKDIIENFNIKASKINIFPLLLEPSNLNYNLQKDREYSLIIVGRLHPSKGHVYLIKQFSECVKVYPKLILKIIGDGILEVELKELTRELKITDNVKFMGSLPNNLVKSEFANSLISVSSSLDEAYGLVNIEALREGTPLLCTKTAGSIDILKLNVNGVYYNNSKNLSLISGVEGILENWKQFSENTLKDFDENYSIDNVSEHFEVLINL